MGASGFMPPPYQHPFHPAMHPMPFGGHPHFGGHPPFMPYSSFARPTLPMQPGYAPISLSSILATTVIYDESSCRRELTDPS
jgi:hypothetical protein